MMSRHTYGMKGHVMTGYQYFSLLWIHAAYINFYNPTLKNLYILFTITHMYIACRVAVYLIWNIV
jgi:hypothetical protein